MERITIKGGFIGSVERTETSPIPQAMADTQDGAHDRVFELLANPRRQLLLRNLAERGGGAPLRDVSRVIAAQETGTDPEEIDGDAVTRVYISLYQTHVPALQDGGLVEYDDEEKVVTLDEYPDEITEILKNWARRRRRWARYYLYVAYALAGLAAVYVLRIVPLPDGLLSAATLVAALGLLGLSIAHYYAVRVSPFERQPFHDLTPLDR